MLKAAPFILIPVNNSSITKFRPLILGLAKPIPEINIYLDACLGK